MKKFYVITGEASGDLHASNLMKEMRAIDQSIRFRFWGGGEMEKVAGRPVKHIKELAFMGFVEVVLNLRTILGNIRFCKKDILLFQPDAIILVDYPGFNLRIAKWAKQQGIKVYYYISPQIWAWKQNRGYLIKQVVDKMAVILPFEKTFYEKFDMEVDYVGHPLLDAIYQFKEKEKEDLFDASRFGLDGRPIITLLPGSRKQEIAKKLPVMLNSIKNIQEYQFVIAGAPSQELSFYNSFLDEHQREDVNVIFGKTYNLLEHSTAALVTSGTATLETALFEVPQVVCYKGSPFSYWIAKRLIKVPYISLVNLIQNKEVVKELIQGECTAKNIRQELEHILPKGSKRERVMREYKLLIEELGGGGASKKAAQLFLED